jgi:hypothetical protein
VGEELAGTRPGFLWLHEQGLGKTATALANYVRCKAGLLVNTIIVICPQSLKGNWPRESKQWGLDITWNVWPDVTSIAEGYVVNYEAMIGRGGDWVEDMVQHRSVFLVLDECHRIKNPSSKVTRQIIGNIRKDAMICRGLTGTPMTQSVDDLWPQLRLAGAVNGMKSTIFRARYAERGGFMGKKVIGIKEHRLEELWALVDTVAHRALKTDWIDLPPKLYREHTSILPPILRNHYMTMMEEFIVELEDERLVTAKMVVSQLIKLQQISSGFVYNNVTRDGRENRAVERLVETRLLPKFKDMMEIIQANGADSKTIVFCHFGESALELIRYIGESIDERPAYLVGGMSTSDVEREKARFNGEIEGDSPSVLVAQISAGKEGHTLLGDVKRGCPCHTVIFYEHNFNLGDRLQSEDRPHRIGQKNAVLYVDMISSPVEAATRAAIVAKKTLVDWVVDHKKDLSKVQI